MSHDEERDDQSSERERPREEGSPITVGGGAGNPIEKERRYLSCKFKDGDFPEEGEPDKGRHKYRHKGSGKIQFLKVRRRGRWDDHAKKLPSNGDCEIIISCKGDDDDVTINGQKFGIDMNPGTYKIVDGLKHTNPDAGSYITYVGLRDLNTNQLEELGDFSEADDCEVWTDHVKPSVYPA